MIRYRKKCYQELKFSYFFLFLTTLKEKFLGSITYGTSGAEARDEFVREYSVPRIITRYQGLSLSTRDYPDFYFLLDWD